MDSSKSSKSNSHTPEYPKAPQDVKVLVGDEWLAMEMAYNGYNEEDETHEWVATMPVYVEDPTKLQMSCGILPAHTSIIVVLAMKENDE